MNASTLCKPGGLEETPSLVGAGPRPARLAARYAWQTCAAVYAWYGVREPEPYIDADVSGHDSEELVDRALHAAGPHTIKFTEACLREHAINPNPVYLAAALDATDRVGPY